MILLELLFSFSLIGVTSFTGVSMVPLINAEMLRHGWMTASEVLDIVAIAEMTPGPLGINCATFSGMRVAGIPGALCATTGVLMPTLTICLLAAIFFKRFKNSKVMQSALSFIRPVSIGLIVATIVTLSVSSYFVNMVPDWTSIIIGGVITFLIWKWDLDVPKLIVTSALLGLLFVR
ncbi:MAG: chromate transporter [Sedimentibacter sp.]|uniref:chromate transporter n=1 Tax=Sedimentibacter sp. TaxID=1960295 RepID=UPI0029828644|nr:chromate transporter [Sedimentibacter sp.]MDW5298614.1 chromate transporter [Sedimentibacter sp.]